MLKNNQKILFLGLLIILVVAVAYVLYAKQYPNQSNVAVNRGTVVLSATEEQALRAVVSNKVDQETKGVWDKNLDIHAVDKSKKAVAGTWQAKDWWDWFAWQGAEDKWNVIVSLDGWDCTELDSIPNEYREFFKNNTYQLPDREEYSNVRYCFDHTGNNDVAKTAYYEEHYDTLVANLKTAPLYSDAETGVQFNLPSYLTAEKRTEGMNSVIEVKFNRPTKLDENQFEKDTTFFTLTVEPGRQVKGCYDLNGRGVAYSIIYPPFSIEGIEYQACIGTGSIFHMELTKGLRTYVIVQEQHNLTYFGRDDKNALREILKTMKIGS